MSIILHARLQYVYWFFFFYLYVLFVKLCFTFVQWPVLRAAAIFTIICCVSGVATYIDKKIFWGRWNIAHIKGDQWKCMQCGENFLNQVHFLREKHKIRAICVEDPTDGIPPGCGNFISDCNQADHRIDTRKCHEARNRICSDTENTEERTRKISGI